MTKWIAIGALFVFVGWVNIKASEERERKEHRIESRLKALEEQP